METISKAIQIPKQDEKTTILREVDAFLHDNNIAIVKTPEQYETAGRVLRAIATRMRTTEDKRLNLVRKFNALRDEATEGHVEAGKRYKAAREQITKRMSAYDAECKRIKEEQERKLQLLQLKEAEKISKKQEKIAQKFEQAGNPERAEYERQIARDAMNVPPPQIAEALPKAEGVSRPKRIKWRLLDITKIPDDSCCLKCGSGEIKRDERYFKRVLDEDKIDGIVKSNGMTTKIPGIEPYIDEGFAVRRLSGDDL